MKNTESHSRLFSGDDAEREEILELFEEAWSSGHTPSIEDYLAASESGDQLQLLLELVYIDLERRLDAGEAIRVESYLQRFSELSNHENMVADLATAEYRLRRRKEQEHDPIRRKAWRRECPQGVSWDSRVPGLSARPLAASLPLSGGSTAGARTAGCRR